MPADKKRTQSRVAKQQETGTLNLMPEEVLASAEQRLQERREIRNQTRQKIAARQYGELDTPKRLRARVDRLQGHPIAGRNVASIEITETLGMEAEPAQEFLERVIGGENFLGVSFFDLGRRAARSVGQIEIRTPDGRSGHGTGFLVSPRLLLTNNHVLSNEEWARRSRVVFDHEDDIDGNPLPRVTFNLDPDAFYWTDRRLDFTVVAVQETSLSGVSLSAYGFNPLDPTQGKISIGEPINIIQHPGGLPKQVVLQDNRLLDLPEDPPDWLHYEADTMPGSSGAPLFNLEWEVVGLHHAGWPRRDATGRILTRTGEIWTEDMGEQAIDWLGNEGARVSRIVKALQDQLSQFPPTGQALLQALLNPRLRGTSVLPIAPVDPEASGTTPRDPEAPKAPERRASAEPSLGLIEKGSSMTSPASGEIRLNIPLEISVRLGTPDFGGRVSDAEAARLRTAAAGVALAESLVLKEPIIDRTYASRTGYDPDFLGGGIEVPLPDVTDLGVVSRMLDGGGFAIAYEHFSVVMHKQRRLALFTASNVDGRESSRRPEPGKDYSRKGLTGLQENEIEKWVMDPRIPAQDQLPDRFFQEDRRAFDKGHIVRRDDVCWGSTYKQIQRANGDTFHTTNCSPQVSKYNQSAAGVNNWGDLENLILSQASTEKYCLFAGPVFKSNDRAFRGVDLQGPVRVKIPRSFWKVVVARKGNRLESFAFVLQQDLDAVQFERLLEARLEEAALDDRQFLEFLPTSEWERKMISIPDLETRLGNLVRFPQAVRDADQFGEPAGEALLRAARLEKLVP